MPQFGTEAAATCLFEGRDLSIHLRAPSFGVQIGRRGTEIGQIGAPDTEHTADAKWRRCCRNDVAECCDRIPTKV